MTVNLSSAQDVDEPVVAIKYISSTGSPGTTTVYAYSQTGYANPDAVSAIGNGICDQHLHLRRQRQPHPSRRLELPVGLPQPHARGRLRQLHDDVCLRRLRLTRAADVHDLHDVLPEQVLLVHLDDIGSNTYATSTNYIWNGDTLLATIDQKLFNGTATGSPITRYIHPDHLGQHERRHRPERQSVQLLDYYPYGATRVST